MKIIKFELLGLILLMILWISSGVAYYEFHIEWAVKWLAIFWIAIPVYILIFGAIGIIKLIH